MKVNLCIYEDEDADDYNAYIYIYIYKSVYLIFSGSLPPSPSDSGVSDVEPSSSSQVFIIAIVVSIVISIIIINFYAVVITSLFGIEYRR